MRVRRWLICAAAVIPTAVAIWYVPPPSPRVNASGRKYDPIEDDPAMKPILEAADREPERRLANDPPDLKAQLGYCHRIWATKKAILREKYGVNWQTPPELNPRTALD